MSGMSQLQYFLVPFPEGASSRSVNVQAALKLLRIEGSLAAAHEDGWNDEKLGVDAETAEAAGLDDALAEALTEGDDWRAWTGAERGDAEEGSEAQEAERVLLVSVLVRWAGTRVQAEAPEAREGCAAMRLLQDLGEARLEGAVLTEAHLEGAALGNAHLDKAALGGAHLQGASLIDAHLGQVYLEGANLDGASLDGANLAEAELNEASLRGAELHGTQLTDATGLELASFDKLPPLVLSAPMHRSHPGPLQFIKGICLGCGDDDDDAGYEDGLYGDEDGGLGEDEKPNSKADDEVKPDVPALDDVGEMDMEELVDALLGSEEDGDEQHIANPMDSDEDQASTESAPDVGKLRAKMRDLTNRRDAARKVCLRERLAFVLSPTHPSDRWDLQRVGKPKVERMEGTLLLKAPPNLGGLSTREIGRNLREWEDSSEEQKLEVLKSMVSLQTNLQRLEATGARDQFGLFVEKAEDDASW